MRPSNEIKTFVRSFEKCRLAAYMPTKNDVPTIGWGATGPEIRLGMVWSQDQADARFDIDCERFAKGVSKLIGGPTRQDQFDAMFSLAFNIGLANFEASSVLRCHNAQEYEAAANHFIDWIKQTNKVTGVKEVLPGLVIRRKAEAGIYR